MYLYFSFFVFSDLFFFFFPFQIHAGTDCNFLQQVVAINPEDRGLSVMGTVKKRFIATPDFDQLIQSSMHL